MVLLRVIIMAEKADMDDRANMASKLARATLKQQVQTSSTGPSGAAGAEHYGQDASKLITLYEAKNTRNSSLIVE